MMFNDRFVVKRRLGQALYGNVYLCEDAARDNALVAIKRVNLRDAKRSLEINQNMDNPWQERKISRLLTTMGGHPNVLAFSTDFLANGAWHIVMEYCNGGDLLTWLQSHPDGRVPASVALGLCRQVAQGLRFLHQSGIAHRDVSLENVLLQNRTCKLSDFGLSTDADRICTESVGKAYYMAPEVVAGESYDPKAADMWSLGILLFILFTGSPIVSLATPDDNAFVAFAKFGVRAVLDVWELTASATPDLIEVLEELLCLDPAKRLTVEELLADPRFIEL